MSHAESELLIEEYCCLLEFPANPDDFVKHLQDKLAQVDEICAVDKQFTINKDGESVFKRIPSLAQTNEVEELESKIRVLMPERSILEILCNVKHWLN
ncbi:MAG: hypothetical protein V7K14_30360 [Nostoc sp.]|uniref:hypothetical protein n=1 Tax=Nostoc sp. TaxID=1180 RepID=UPI002FF759FA